MKLLISATLAFILLTIAAASADERTITIVFTNNLDRRTLVMSNGVVPQVIGSFQFGGQLVVNVYVPDDSVPTSVWWTAGEFGGKITITEDTDDYLEVTLDRRGAGRPRWIDETNGW
jgi:hypothetical protein